MWKVWNSCGVFGARQRHAEEANLGLSEFANCLACNFWCCDIKVSKVLLTNRIEVWEYKCCNKQLF